MSILDIFNFKSKFAEVFNTENFDNIREVAKSEIVKQIKAKVEKNEEKMDAVVEKVNEYIASKLKSSNKIVQWIIDKLLIPNVRIWTQSIYDDLKTVIKGL